MKSKVQFYLATEKNSKTFYKWKQKNRYCYLSSVKHRFPEVLCQGGFYSSSQRQSLTLEFYGCISEQNIRI
jgi:hypothetical protein